jgi:hypothetical protein
MYEEFNSDRQKTKLLIVIAIVWAVFILMQLLGCSVDKMAQKKTAWLIAHDRLDDICARVYPNRDSVTVKDSVSFDTSYVSNDVYLRDTIYRDGDTIYREKKCPPAQVITKYVNHDSTIYRTNTADVDRLKGELLDKDKQLKAKDDIVIKQQQKIDKEDWWKTACLITWFAMVLVIVARLFIIKRPI